MSSINSGIFNKPILLSAMALQLVLLSTASFANELSMDITVQAASVADDGDTFTSGGIVTSLPGLPQSADLIAYHLDADGNHLFALDTTVQLPGSELAFPGDVMSYDGANYSNVWRAADEGLPRGVMTDAISTIGDDLILSFTQTVNLDGVIADDEDLVQISPAGPILLLDGSAQGLNAATDVDAVSYLPDEDGLIYISLDISGSVGGLNFDDEDVLEYRLSDGQWRKYNSGGTRYASAHLDAFLVNTDMFSDGFESAE
jgi:hypothetical protein